METHEPNLLKKRESSGDIKYQDESADSKETKLVTPQSPKPGRSPFLRRNGSLGKGPTKTTVPQGFKLATEARSLIRPCGCGKDGVFAPHGQGHGHTHHKKAPVLPEISNRGSKVPKSPQMTRKAKEIPADEQPKPKVSSSSKKVSPKTSALPVPTKSPPTKPARTKSLPTTSPKPLEVEGTNRFVSTVVWYPEMQPEFNSTRLKISPGEDTYRVVDEILVKEYDSYLKKMLPASSKEMRELDGPLLMKKVETNDFGKMIEGSWTSCNLNNPISIS